MSEDSNFSTISELDDYTPDMLERGGDNIEFGASATEHGVIQDLNQPNNSEYDSEATKTLQAVDEPIKHEGGGTLMIDSPLLLALEESETGASQDDKSSHSGIIIALITIIALGGIFALFIFSNNNDAKKAEQPVEEAVDDAIVPDYTPLKTNYIPISVRPKRANVILNGALYDPASQMTNDGTYPLLANYDNVLSVYASGFIPYFQRVAKDHNFSENPLNIELTPDDFYQRSSVTIKLPPNADLASTKLIVNGETQILSNNIVLDCLSGFPYYIYVQNNDLGSHLHVFWPTKTDEVVELPNLVTANAAKGVTIFTLKLPKAYEQDSSLKVYVKTDEGHLLSQGSMRVSKGQFINVSVTKNGRYPMDLGFDSTPFGSITIDGYMQPSSKGVATVKFSKQSDKDIQLCFRRSSEVVCTSSKEENYVSSGKWEMIAYREVAGQKEILKEQPFETLKQNTDYIFTLTSNGSNSYKYAIKESKK